jgi:hypothetical protein
MIRIKLIMALLWLDLQWSVLAYTDLITVPYRKVVERWKESV